MPTILTTVTKSLQLAVFGISQEGCITVFPRCPYWIMSIFWLLTLDDNALKFPEDIALLTSWSAPTLAGYRLNFRVPYSLISVGLINYS